MRDPHEPFVSSRMANASPSVPTPAIRNAAVWTVARLPRLQAPVVDLAKDGRPDQTVTHPHVTPAGQQRPFGRRLQCVRLGQQLDPGRVRHPQVGQHQRHLPVSRLDLLQRRQRGRPRTLAEHLVVGSVALAQLCLDAAARRRLVINRQQHRSHHGQVSRPSSPPRGRPVPPVRALVTDLEVPGLDEAALVRKDHHLGTVAQAELDEDA
jgi:hypothetical protein